MRLLITQTKIKKSTGINLNQIKYIMPQDLPYITERNKKKKNKFVERRYNLVRTP